MQEILKIVFVIIGTLIGAGFISGKEIYLFFYKYGIYGFFGIILMSLFFGIIIYKLLIKIKKYKINNYEELLNKINNNKIIINLLIKKIINVFLLISFFIMVACFGALINQIYKIPIFISNIFFCILCDLIYFKNINGIIKINQILIPILIFFMLFIGINIFLNNNINLFSLEKININYLKIKNNINWIFYSLLYVSYNSILLIPVISNLELKKLNYDKITKISIISSLLIFLLSGIIFFILIKGNNYFFNLELPIEAIIEKYLYKAKIIYIFIIFIAIFTSSVSAGYSFLINVSKNKKQFIFYLIIINFFAILVSNIGFSKLVEILYPFFGFLGLIQILLIIK